MKEKTLNEVLIELRVSLENDDLTGAIKLIEALRPADQADLVQELDAPDQVALLTLLDPIDSASVLEDCGFSTAEIASLQADAVIPGG